MYSFFDGTDYIHYNRYLFNRIQNILFNENVRAYFYYLRLKNFLI